MSALGRMLYATFKPPKAPDTHRKAREASKRLAALHGIEITKDRGYDGFNVYPPRSFDGVDPFDGDHFANAWSEVLPMVVAYASLLETP